MRLPHVSHIAVFFCTFQQVRISHIFPQKLAFMTAVLIFFVFLFESIFVLVRKWLQLGNSHGNVDADKCSPMLVIEYGTTGFNCLVLVNILNVML